MIRAIGMVLAMTLSAYAGDVPIKVKIGGILDRPGTVKGKVAFIDTQSRSDIAGEMKGVVSNFHSRLPINIVYVKAAAGEPEELKKREGADFAIVIMDDPKLPPTVIVPDLRYATVNVAKLHIGKEDPSKDSDLYQKRCCKAALRAFVLLCNGGGSRYQGHVGCASTVADLDLAHDQLPVDIQQGIRAYLNKCGVWPQLRATYKKACEEGWAPAPTNEYQKAVWDKVHAMPTNPMKIEFDPKKGR